MLQDGVGPHLPYARQCHELLQAGAVEIGHWWAIRLWRRGDGRLFAYGGDVVVVLVLHVRGQVHTSEVSVCDCAPCAVDSVLETVTLLEGVHARAGHGARHVDLDRRSGRGGG